MFCCILLLAVSETLSCRNPFFAFSNDVWSAERVDEAFVYDLIDGVGKSSRITTNTVSFGAAKVSALVERAIAGEGWKIRKYRGENPSEQDDYKLVGDETSIRDVARTGGLPYGGIGEEYASPSNRHLSYSDPSWRLTANNLVGTAVGTSDFASGLTNLDTYAKGLKISKIWEKYEDYPPLFESLDESQVLNELTSTAVARTFPCLTTLRQDSRNTGLLYAANYMGSAMIEETFAGFFEPILRRLNDPREAGRIRSYAYPGYEPFVTCRFDDLLSRFCNPLDLDRKTGRPNYGKSSAESWLVALKDADLFELVPNAERKQYYVNFEAAFPVTLDRDKVRETRVVWDDEKKCYHVLMATDSIKIGNPTNVIITTNSCSFNSFGQIDDSLNDQVFSHSIYFDYGRIFRLDVDALRRIIPDDGYNHTLYGILDTDYGYYDIFATGSYFSAIPDEIQNTNMLFICTMSRTGSGSFAAKSNEFSYSTNAFDFAWAITNGFFSNQNLYNVNSVGERIRRDDVQFYDTTNCFKASITSRFISPTNDVMKYVSEVGQAYDDVLAKLDIFESESDKGANLRNGLILPPLSSKEIQEEMFGFDLVADRIITLDSFFINGGEVVNANDGKVVRDYYYFKYPLNYSSDISEEKDNREYFGDFGFMLKVIYSFDNLCPSWAKRN